MKNRLNKLIIAGIPYLGKLAERGEEKAILKILAAGPLHQGTIHSKSDMPFCTVLTVLERLERAGKVENKETAFVWGIVE